MSGQKISIKVPTPPDGALRDIEGIEISIRRTSEQWSEIELDDGTVIRYKPTITRVLKIEGQFDQEDNPVYITQSAQLMTVNSPKELRRKRQ